MNQTQVAAVKKGPSSAPPPPEEDRSPGSFLFLFVFFSVFWFILSGRAGIPYFTMMVLTLGIVLVLNRDRPFPTGLTGVEGGIRGRLVMTYHLGRYLVWLVYNVVKANVEVAVMVLRPSLPIRPAMLTLRTELRSELAQVLVANSITLTPGTITVDLQNGEYLIHAIHPRSAKSVTEGELQNVVAAIFQEPPDPVPEVRWIRSIEELAG